MKKNTNHYMTEFEKKYELSVTDLKRVKRRLSCMIDIADKSMSSMERAADRCWENANAEERYMELSDKMLKLERKQNLLDEISKDMEHLLEKFEEIESPKN